MTIQELRERCAFWQRLLRLQDWRIDVRWGTADEMVEDAMGRCDPHQDAKIAVVKMLPPGAFNQHSHMMEAFPQDPELVLVHELVHIHLDQVMDDAGEASAEQVAQEQAVEMIAQALLAAHRGQDSVYPDAHARRGS